jgi:hypothetical protein
MGRIDHAVAGHGYLSVPMLWAAMTWDGMPFGLPPADRIALLVLDLVGLLAGIGLLLRVGQLLRRRRAFISMVEAWVLALAVAAAIVYASGNGDQGPSSLTFLYSLPVYPYGIPEIYINVIARPPYPSPLREPLLWAYLALPVWSLSLVLRLLCRYRASAIAAERDAAQGAPS